MEVGELDDAEVLAPRVFVRGVFVGADDEAQVIIGVAKETEARAKHAHEGDAAKKYPDPFHGNNDSKPP